MPNIFFMNLGTIQPSQLYVSESKLQSVMSWFSSCDIEDYDAIPIKELDGVIFFTDGHTRALASYLNGVEKVKVYWDEDDLDWDAYRECIRWCVDEGITAIGNLSNRIITHEQYKMLWFDRCQEMQDRLKAERELIKSYW